MNKRNRIISEIICLVAYIATVVGGVLTDRLPWVSIVMAAVYGLVGIGNLIVDIDFHNKKIRPTVRTIGLFVLMIVFIYLAFK